MTTFTRQSQRRSQQAAAALNNELLSTHANPKMWNCRFNDFMHALMRRMHSIVIHIHLEFVIRRFYTRVRLVCNRFNKVYTACLLTHLFTSLYIHTSYPLSRQAAGNTFAEAKVAIVVLSATKQSKVSQVAILKLKSEE